MPGDFEYGVEIAALLVAALVLPFYMGFLHAALPQLLLYSGVAGAGIAAGERLRFAGQGNERVTDFVIDAGLSGAAVLGIGAVAYVIALLTV